MFILYEAEIRITFFIGHFDNVWKHLHAKRRYLVTILEAH